MTRTNPVFLEAGETAPAGLPGTSGKVQSARPTVRPRATLAWIEALKACALVWIFLDHVAEQSIGSPIFANPGPHWPPFAERIHQFVTGAGVPAAGAAWTGFLVALRDFSWMGDQGVALFLLLSGLTLTISCLRTDSANEPASASILKPSFWTGFYRKRLLRIYPMWIAAHLLLLFPFAIAGIKLTLLDSRLYWSLLGIRVLPAQLYYGNPSWWFVTLLLELYVVFPLLWMALRRMGPGLFLGAIAVPALLIRGLGLLAFDNYLDAWSRGAIFVTRLPEFALGMAAAVVLSGSQGTRWDTLPSRGVSAACGTLSLVLGLACSFTLTGMTVAPLLIGAGAFLLLTAIFRSDAAPQTVAGKVLNWIGRHSLSLFLVHQLLVRALLPEPGQSVSALRFFLRLVLVLAGTALFAIALERATDIGVAFFRRGLARWGGRGLAIRVLTPVLALWGVLIAGDLAVRRLAPVEVADFGWGERPSLEPDPVFGWKLRPDQQTHLRWTSYDYTVQANRLGFPGPEYPTGAPAPGVERILVTGDAFTSAEGVNTNDAWPRQLERDLAKRIAGRVEVMNFAITGYGPNQYSAVIAHFAPIYRPNVILVGSFINDFDDALTSTEEFQDSIGFSKIAENSLAGVVTFRELSAFLHQRFSRALYRYVLPKPDPNGYFLGQFSALERGPDGAVAKGRARLSDRFAEIKRVSDQIGARLIVVLIPSGPQVCSARTLDYWPKKVSLSDPKFDARLPQRTEEEIGRRLGIETFDLLPALQTVNGCPYQQQNMHWTVQAHEASARSVTELLAGSKRQ